MNQYREKDTGGNKGVFKDARRTEPEAEPEEMTIDFDTPTGRILLVWFITVVIGYILMVGVLPLIFPQGVIYVSVPPADIPLPVGGAP